MAYRNPSQDFSSPELDAVRVGITDIDSRVARDWVLRGAMVVRAGRLKPLGARDPAREEEVIRNVRETADQASAAQGLVLEGLPALIEQTYRGFLNGIVELQQAQLEREQTVKEAG